MGYPTVRLISDGQSVDEIYANKPLADLIERTDYLTARLDNLTGDFSKLIISDAPCSDSCLDSNTVFFDPETSKWDRALATLVHPGVPVEERLAPSGFVQGIIKDISGSVGSKIGTVILGGVITDLNIINFTAENEVIVGAPLYLAGTSGYDGQLTYTPPSVEIFCGKFISTGEFLFTLDVRNIGERHKHIWFQLDMSLWEEVEADHWLYSCFNFPDYSEGGAYWPPISYSSAVLSVNGVNYFQDAGQTYFYLNADGVHYVNAEFPIDATDEDILTMVLYYQIAYGQDDDAAAGVGGVSSLYVRTPNLNVYRQGTTTAAATGNLEIGCIPITAVASITTIGSSVIKSLVVDTSTGQLNVYKGLVAEQIYGGTNNVKTTYYTDDANGATTHTGFLAVHVIPEVAFTAPETEVGSLVFKDIAVDAITGEISIDRGLVVESIEPVTDSRLQIFTHGTSTPATQGTLDIKIRDLYRVRYAYADVVAGLAAQKIFESSGHMDHERLLRSGCIIGAYASIDRKVLAGQIALVPYTQEIGGAEVNLTTLTLTLDSVTNTYWTSAEVAYDLYAYTSGAKLGVKATDSGGLTLDVGVAPDYASMEIVLLVIKD